MIVVITEETNIADLTKALRRGGYVLRAKPGGIFELVRVNRVPTCEVCDEPASFRSHDADLCSAHAAALLDRAN